MDSTVSVSKGVFVFKNGLESLKQMKRKNKKNVKNAYNSNIFEGHLWYQSYSNLWNSIEKKIDNLNKEMYENVLSNLVDFIKTSYTNPVIEIPTAALLTGVNMPDHAALFTALGKQVKHDISPHVACLYSQDCQNIKHLVENMIGQFINEDGFSSDEEFETVPSSAKYKIRKSQYSFSVLQAWYENEYKYPLHKSPKTHRHKQEHKVLVVIIPDFESFSDKVLQDFVLITSSYINILPFVLVFGVATSLTILHKMLPFQVSSKVNIQVFNSQQSATYLNNVWENIFFSDDCPFHLGGKVFTLFTDIFLFHELSVTGFIQKYKFAMYEHFSNGNAMALCAKPKKVNELINNFSHEDCDSVRRLLSFRKLLENESEEIKIKLLADDDYFKTVLKQDVNHMFKYLSTFHVYLKCLHILVSDLPNVPLGKHLRELYSVASSKDITTTNDYKECFQLLSFQSKDELTTKAIKVCELIENELSDQKIRKLNLEDDVENLCKFIEDIELATLEYDETEELTNQMDTIAIGGKMDRKQLKEKLLGMAKQSKPMNKYEIARKKLLDFISGLFEKYLYSPKLNNFYEIFFFDDISIQNHIIGGHRAAIHTALNDPHYYLMCSCCKLPNSSVILKTMPDICIIYKLHLEYGKTINLYDWLQAFASIIEPIGPDEDEEEEKEIDSKLHARFMQAVAELEFLGFIKSSKRNPDHVQRLTWGG